MLRTQVRIRQAGDTIVTANVIASTKVAGYIFLIHRDVENKEKFTVTYAPVGLSVGITRSMWDINNVFFYLKENEHRLAPAIHTAIATMQANHMPLLSAETGIETYDWRYREEQRFEDDDYKPVPSLKSLIKIIDYNYPKDHYVHLSVTKSETDFIAYTPNDDYGNKDRQVRMRYGKYLKKTFPSLTDAEVQSAVTSFRTTLALAESPATLMFTTDRATINDIFETEMYACDSNYASCMHGKFSGQEIRPYHVYADSPDVAVAYVMEYGKIIARSVVSTKDKVWVRAYSIEAAGSTTCGILIRLLEAAGYREGDLTGNRLTKLETPRVMLPYIDHGGMGVQASGNYWVVCAEGEGDYNADGTDGTGSITESYCQACDNTELECCCVVCECCEDRNCERCLFCENCHSCMEHDGCSCERCSECSRIIAPSHRYVTACSCDRCDECNELDSECECEPEEEENEPESEAVAS